MAEGSRRVLQANNERGGRMTKREIEILEEMRKTINSDQCDSYYETSDLEKHMLDKAISELKKSCTEPTNCLVLRANAYITQDNLNHYRRTFEEQMLSGVVVIPAMFDIVCVTKDTEIKMEGMHNDKHE